MAWKLISDGLGGTFGVSQTLHMGGKKELKRKHFYFCFLPVLLVSLLNVSTYCVFCESIIISLQRSNEVYRDIKCPHAYITPASFENNLSFSIKLYCCLVTLVIITWVFVLILNCGDVHPNPGPGSDNDLADLSQSSSNDSFELLSNHLSIVHFNVQSLLPKMDILRGEAEAYDILVFSETWLKPVINNDSILIENFSPPFRKDRSDRTGGGVAIYVRDTLTCKQRQDLEINGLEAKWVEIVVKSKKILIGGFYRPPNSTVDYFNMILESIDRAFNTNVNDIIITGDFNYDMSSSENNKIKDLMLQYHLTQLIVDPTNFSENSASLIDLFLVRNTSNVLYSGVLDSFIPDQVRFHCPIILLLKFVRPTLKSFKRRIWNYNLADYDKYRNLLSRLNLTRDLTIENVDDVVQSITEDLYNTGLECIPNKVVTIRPSDHPWITTKIRKLIRKRKRTYRNYKKTNYITLWERYKKLRNLVVKEIRTSKSEYFEKLENLINADTIDPKTFWKASKSLLGKNKKLHTIPPLFSNGRYAGTDKENANILNDFFSTQSTVNDTNKELPPVRPITHVKLQTVNFTRQDVKDVLLNLKVSKACGPDLISPRLLKEGADLLADPLSVLFNFLIINGYFPKPWKDANVTPVDKKKDDKSLPSNYRPISLLNQISKVMERCVHKQIYNYINTNHLITPLQSGFIPGDSTTFQLLHTYHCFCEAVDSGKEVRVVFCDISKAFDRVWHKGLLHKLSSVGISGNLLKWFSSYLSNRRQRVVLNGTCSEWTYVKAGVPQGSILGPLLFLVYINDIVNEIHSNIRLFADDTSLYIIVDNPLTAATTLNLDLGIITRWANDWLVDFNPSKTVSMVVSRKLAQTNHPPLLMNNTVITESSSHKHLGLIFSKVCTWSEHIKYITDNAWSRLNLLRVLKFKIKRQSLQKLYYAFIRPLLEYSCSVWDNCSTEDKKLLESIHTEAARIITGATKLCNVERLYSELGWETLQERRNKQKLIIFYKIIHNETPTYLNDLIPPIVENANRYNLRNSNDICTLRCRTNLYYNSFLPSTIRAWNTLSIDIKEAPSVSSFKYRLNRNIIQPPKYYNSGSRIGQILHTRLRLGCSSLNSDLYRKNIVDSPSCSCGGFESAYHFFYICPKYTQLRNTCFTDELQTLNTNQLLFGMPNATIEENKLLFAKVQDFIVKSKRFL
ncbi:MAG: reverse transcriptase family protein [Candidatus Thiodiazotropha sp.]